MPWKLEIIRLNLALHPSCSILYRWRQIVSCTLHTAESILDAGLVRDMGMALTQEDLVESTSWSIFPIHDLILLKLWSLSTVAVGAGRSLPGTYNTFDRGIVEICIAASWNESRPRVCGPALAAPPLRCGLLVFTKTLSGWVPKGGHKRKEKNRDHHLCSWPFRRALMPL